MYDTYRRYPETDEYHQQEADDNSYDNTPAPQTTATTTTTVVTTTPALRPSFMEYNPSIDMGQYCGACRYYSRRLHVKKFCKRDYSMLKKLI